MNKSAIRKKEKYALQKHALDSNYHTNKDVP